MAERKSQTKIKFLQEDI